jgi:hypothetical protein
VSSPSAAELLGYWRERIVKVRTALLVVLVAGLGFLADPPTGTLQALARIALAALLITQFRLWDDLADRDHDRQRHPERVLARHVGRATHFYAALGVLSLPIVLLLLSFPNPAWRIAAYGSLALVVAVVYGSQVTAHGRVMRMGWVLLKYPVFVLLPLAAPTSANALVAAAVVYLVVMLYDWATSPDAEDLRRARRDPADAAMFEPVSCYACGSAESVPFVNAEDDFSGMPGRFTFVRCRNCRLAYQNPRLKREHLGRHLPQHAARHPGAGDWGWLEPLRARAAAKYEREKVALVLRHAQLGPRSRALDVDGAHSGFAARLGQETGAQCLAVDQLENGPLERGGFDLITLWDRLEQDYDPAGTLRAARDLLVPGGNLVIEVPRLDSLTWRLYHERWPGIRAPRNTVLFTRQSLQMMIEAAGLQVVEHLPYGAFPPYFYLFAGAAFKVLKGRSPDAAHAVLPYLAGRVLSFPLLLLERRLDLALQTFVCRRPGPADG